MPLQIWKTIWAKFSLFILDTTEETLKENNGTRSSITSNINNKPSEDPSDQKGEKEKSSKSEKEIELHPCQSKLTQKDEINIHPLDATIHLSVHQKLLPPGKIIHIVRHYEGNRR